MDAPAPGKGGLDTGEILKQAVGDDALSPLAEPPPPPSGDLPWFQTAEMPVMRRPDPWMNSGTEGIPVGLPDLIDFEAHPDETADEDDDEGQVAAPETAQPTAETAAPMSYFAAGLLLGLLAGAGLAKALL